MAAEANNGRVHGLLGEFEHAGGLLRAARGVHEAGYKKFDAHSPFAIHGMDKAMGLGQSILGFLVFWGAALGCYLGYLMQYWMSEVDYPINISGKPFFAIEPSIPIMFELTILFATLTAVFGMFALNKLPAPYNPLFYSKRFTRVTDDAFFLHIESTDAQFDEDATATLLRDLGAVNVEIIEDLGHHEE